MFVVLPARVKPQSLTSVCMHGLSHNVQKGMGAMFYLQNESQLLILAL
jgi:hypothetical protein